MAEVAPAVAPVKAPAKAQKKKNVPRPKKDGPTLPKLIVTVVAESKEKKGVSTSAIKKALAAKGIDVLSANKRINNALTKLVERGTLTQVKGLGASGSFKITKEAKETKPVKKTIKKPAAKAKKPSAKKPAAAKKLAKAAVKSSPKKKAATTKTATKKTVKKSSKKTPAKKAVKKAPVKKTPTKKAPAKKTAAKKSAKKTAAKK